MVECCLQVWFREHKAYRALSLYIFLGIWKARNTLIFEHKVPDVQETCIRISFDFLEKGLVTMTQNTRHITLRDVWDNFPVGFFDGAAQAEICGSGMVIYLIPHEYYCFKWHSGQGTNTRAKLLALWGILYCATWTGLDEIDFFGDSKVIID